jgi:hypothetical protein
MLERLAGDLVHAAEPEPGSFRAATGDGDDADLFNLSHYPVHAVCRVCNEPIQAETFMLAFAHEVLAAGLLRHEGQAVTGQRGGQ